MVLTASTRKRVRQIETEDLYPNPEFMRGPKAVPEAELQHVTPPATGEQAALGEQVRAKNDTIEFLHDEINRRLSVIEDCQGRISEMLACINEEKNRIRDLLR